jgi:hypothetical protein
VGEGDVVCVPAEWWALGGGERGVGVVSSQGFVFAGEKEAAFVNQIQEEDRKLFEFVVFSPLCNKRAGS